MNKTCDNCKFSKVKVMRLECRRFPPTLLSANSMHFEDLSKFPNVKGDDWCGEWVTDRPKSGGCASCAYGLYKDGKGGFIPCEICGRTD